MQNLGFVYELYMLLILKNCLVSFSKPTLLFWHGSLMTQWVKVILLITQKSHLSSCRMLIIKTVLFTFCHIKKESFKEKDKDVQFMNALLVSKKSKDNMKI